MSDTPSEGELGGARLSLNKSMISELEEKSVVSG